MGRRKHNSTRQRHQPKLSWHQKQLRKAAIWLGLIILVVFGVLMYFLNRQGHI